MIQKTAPGGSGFLRVKKASQSFLRQQKIESKGIFGRGVYVDENTSQAASVEFVCHEQTNYARSRLQKPAEKPHMGLFGSLKTAPTGSGFVILLRLAAGGSHRDFR